MVMLAEALSAGAVEEIAPSKSLLAQLKHILMNTAGIRRSFRGAEAEHQAPEEAKQARDGVREWLAAAEDGDEEAYGC